MKIHRAWSMPNKETFKMAPVAALLNRYCRLGLTVADPFAGNSRYGTLTNDINQRTKAIDHVDAVEWLQRMVKAGILCDVLLLDPPYSPRQMQEHYKRPGVGRLSCSTALLMGQVRKLAPALVEFGGHAITCGWNSNGMGAPFQLVEVLLVAHGSSHNDTIITVEVLP
jgi:hypothetical protein